MNSSTSPVDIRPDHLEIVQNILREHLPAGCQAWVFGSRANWTTKDSSDLDLAVEGANTLDYKTMAGLEIAFEESDLPYTVDIVDLNSVSPKFREIVEEQKVPLSETAKYVSAGLKWREAPLGEVIEFKRGYDLPQGSRLPGDAPVVSSSGITDWHSEAKVRGPGVVTGRYGTLGEIYFIREDFWPLNTALYVRDFKGNDPRFISYFLRSLNFFVYSDKAAVPGLNRNHLHEAIVRYPTSIEEQRSIAHILGTLDDKIELNRRMNQTLEAMARAVFQDWFVDFGPVRAKLEGREPYLPPELWDLFPDRLVDSELGEVPEGWGFGEIGDVATQRRQSVKPECIEPDTPYIALDHMPRKCIALSEWDRAEGLASGKFGFKEWDILFGKLRPYFHKVGVAPLDGVCSTDIVVVSPKSEVWFGFTLGHMSSSEFVDYTDAASTGTRMPRTNWTDMSKYKVPLPSLELANAFAQQIVPLVDKIVSTIHESRALAIQRDALLPRLVSGEVRVGESSITY